MIDLSLISLDHENSGTLRWLGQRMRCKTKVGVVRGTATCRVQVGDVYLTKEEARDLARSIALAAQAVEQHEHTVSGRRSYRVWREDGVVHCEHMGRRGPMRLLRPRKRCYVCDECKSESGVVYVPVHTPWKGHDEVCATLCVPCVQKLERAPLGIRVVK